MKVERKQRGGKREKKESERIKKEKNRCRKGIRTKNESGVEL